ncbi:MAG: AAA family ATPase [Acidobacteria bacterium]|nr:AAA family ATPase [Acidobacteriota bacterium]
MTTDGRLLTRVVLRNYKSIPACDVSPPKLCFLVGPNGSGKSNFLDALRLVSDSLQHSLDHALRDRGGTHEVRRRSSGHPTHFGIRLEFEIDDAMGHFAFEVGAMRNGGYRVQQEECRIVDAANEEHFYQIVNGEVRRSTFAPSPPASAARLYLLVASSYPPFRAVYEALSALGFYNLNPQAIRTPQPPDPGEILKRDGSNIASVVSHLASQAPELKERVEDYLSAIVPGLERVDFRNVGHLETLEFRQKVRGAKHAWRFYAGNMSDGTLRALGVLVALLHAGANGSAPTRLVGIEEPEVALHPAASEVLVDAIRDASERTQILVTSHSPDLLDHIGADTDLLLAVEAVNGETRIEPLHETSRSALSERLFTPGELLRMDRLNPRGALFGSDPMQISLFGAAR